MPTRTLVINGYYARVFRYFLSTAFNQMGRFRAQSALVILGVGIGIANIILLMNMTDMGRRQTLGLLEDFGARVLIIVPYVDFSAGPLSVFSQANAMGHVPIAAYEQLKDCEALDLRTDGLPGRQVSAMLPLGSTVESDNASRYTVVAGATDLVADFGQFEVFAGRWVSLEDEQTGRNAAVLGEKLAGELFRDAEALGAEVRIRGESFTVIGLMRQKPGAGGNLEEHDSRAFIPMSTAHRLFDFDGVQGILARYREGLSAAEAMDEARACMSLGLPDGMEIDDVVSVFTIEEATRLMDNTLSIFRTVLLGVASIALIVAGIGILNVMLIRVLRRRTEIGLRRAVGASTRSIVAQFILESAVQALCGAMLGLAIGAGGLWLFADIAGWQFYISPRTLILAMGFGALVGVVFGAYPAYTAGRVDPIASLRYEM